MSSSSHEEPQKYEMLPLPWRASLLETPLLPTARPLGSPSLPLGPYWAQKKTTELQRNNLVREHTVFHTCRQLSVLRRSMLWQMRFIPRRRYLSAEIRSSSKASGLLSGKTPETVEAAGTGRGGGSGDGQRNRNKCIWWLPRQSWTISSTGQKKRSGWRQPSVK